MGSPTLLRRACLTLALACAAAGCRRSPGTAVAPPPSIAAPALALFHEDPADNPARSVYLSVNGAGFGAPGGGPPGPCGAAGSAASLELSPAAGPATQLAAGAGEVAVWTDTLVVVALAPGSVPARVRVCAGGGASPEAAVESYAYAHFPVPPPGPPLAVTVDRGGRVWINSEFDFKLKYFEPAARQILAVDVPHGPGPGAYSDHLFGFDAQTWFSASNEDVVVDPLGRVWFSQAGFSPIPGPAESFPDHSRIAAYDPAAGTFRVYNVPGDRNGVVGLAWDDLRRRVWFTETARNSGGFFPVVALRARLASFDPARIAPDAQFDFASTATCLAGPAGKPGSCSDVATRPCLRDSDCVLAGQVCPPGAIDDSTCWHEFELPATFPSFQPAHLVADPGGALWFTDYWVGSSIGRLDPASGAFSRFPLPAPEARASCSYQGCSCFCTAGDGACRPCDAYCCQLLNLDSAPWFIAQGRGGELWFTEYLNGAVGRLPREAAADARCQQLASDGTNPCLREWIVPGIDHPHQTVHSLALDGAGRVWFTQGGGQDQPGDPTTVGYLPPDQGPMRLFAPLSLYPFASDGTHCVGPAGRFVSFNGAGVAVDPRTDDVWFADYCRRRLGLLSRLP